MTTKDDKAQSFTISRVNDWDDEFVYHVHADSELYAVIEKHISSGKLEVEIPVTSLDATDVGHRIRYNNDEEGMLELVEHEGDVTHLTIDGKKMTSTDYYEKIMFLPRL